MKAIISKLWGKTRLPLFIIILCLGSIGWTTFYFLFPPMYQESQEVWKSHIERIENSVGDPVGVGSVEPTSTESYAQPEGEEADTLVSSPPSVEEKIKNTFKDEYKIALAVAKAESGLRENAQGFNCRYNGISQACRKGDESKAWSVDCGLFQHNIKGTTCPQNLFNPDENIQLAFEKYQKRNWQPWNSSRSKWE